MRSLVGILLLCLVQLSSAHAGEIRLSVAASMTDAVEELIATYAKRTNGVRFLPNFASSGSLAKQISQGAPADIFISANPEWMQYLVDEKRIAADRVRTFAHNTLVFLGKKDSLVHSLQDLTRLQRIAVGSPKSVPAGKYAEQALTAAGLYTHLQRKLVLAKDVRQALLYADRGETDGAFVYKTDALLANTAVILLQVPQNLYPEITYPAALTRQAEGNPEAERFFEFLRSDEVLEILEKHGFIRP